MTHRTQGRVSRQINSLQTRLAQTGGLPFSQLLDRSLVEQTLREEDVSFRNRLYTPMVTLWVFLSQVLDSVHGCTQAVARFLAYRIAQGLAACSSETGAYCQARKRLPEGVLARLTRTTGRQLHEREQPTAWRWLGRPVKVGDATTVSMPDTPANQAAFPQPKTQKPGVGFPLARLMVIFSLAVGTALDAAMGSFKGKGTGELSLFRQLRDTLQPGDVFLGDRAYCAYADLAWMRAHGIDAVVRLHQHRHADFRRGQRLGPNDHLVTWTKPPRPRGVDRDTYRQWPDTLTLREVRVLVTQAGFRTQEIILVTTLLDADAVSVKDLADLYRARWQAELDLRSLKRTLQLDVLRCKSPALVRKEIWAHLLAYNLIRGVMADAAEKHGVLPAQLSFAAAWQTLAAFAPYLALPAITLEEVYDHLLDALARHRVGDRPDRYEPRVKKRRPKAYPFMQVPRSLGRKHCLQRSKL